MKKVILIALAAALMSAVFAEAEYAADRQALSDMSVEELCALEDAVVLALKDVFVKEAAQSPEGEIVGTYTVNPKTGKFHFPWCYSALQIGERRRFVTCAPSELAALGYKPCGQCKPYLETEN